MSKFSKEQIDAKVEYVLRTKEMIKALQEHVADVQKELESGFELPAKDAEVLIGNEYKVVKTPRNLGKNELDYNAAAQLLTPEELKLVEKTIIDVEKLKAMIKSKAIDECLLPMIREDKYTYATSFKHIENVKTTEVKIKNKINA